MMAPPRIYHLSADGDKPPTELEVARMTFDEAQREIVDLEARKPSRPWRKLSYIIGLMSETLDRLISIEEQRSGERGRPIHDEHVAASAPMGTTRSSRRAPGAVRRAA